jgi:hypothetical protein
MDVSEFLCMMQMDRQNTKKGDKDVLRIGPIENFPMTHRPNNDTTLGDADYPCRRDFHSIHKIYL